jgi:LPS sulfotransferase NodH
VFLLLREDVVAQAVSLHIAAATDEWSSLRSDSNRRSEGSSRRESVRYDAEAITRHLRLIQYQNQAWIEFLSTNGIRHHVITYEMIQDDPVGVVRMIAARTGVELDRSRITAKVRYRRQATDIDVAFAARYRADSGMRLPGSAGEGSVVRVDGTLVVPMPIESHVAPVGTPLGQGAPMGTPVGDVGPRAARPR